jgi:hypothetical protein
MSLANLTQTFGRQAPEPQALKCRIGLPSSSAVENLLDGDASAIGPVIGSMAGRAALVGLGAYAAGLRGGNVARAGIGGAVMIELFVLGWVAMNRDPASRSEPA